MKNYFCNKYLCLYVLLNNKETYLKLEDICTKSHFIGFYPQLKEKKTEVNSI